MKRVLQIDKYAKDGKTWKLHAEINYQAALALFTHHSARLMLCFPAAVLGHHAIEAYLKSALILGGFTIFDPYKVGQLDRVHGLERAKCAWGHQLVQLGEKLTTMRPDFDLNAVIIDYWPPYNMAITVRKGLEIFDPFFTELRYPSQLDKCEGLGPDDVVILERLVGAIRPFTP